MSQKKQSTLFMVINIAHLLLGLYDKDINTNDVECISKYPSLEIVLKIEGNPPLGIFYSPKNRVVIMNKMKRIRV